MGRIFKVCLAFVALAAMPAAAHGAVPLAQCPGGASGQCGSVSVPLDRSHPAAGNIDIHFVVFGHTDTTQPPLGTIFVTEGGPGDSVTNDERDVYPQFALKALNGRRDIVEIDQRGVGDSGVIDCPKLQMENSDIYAAAVGCATQLGASADLYGGADVAKDVEAVRAALGIDKIDYYGGSFAGEDIEAYAARFAAHLRSVVLDSPVYLPAEEPFFADSITQAIRTVSLVCGRSPSCHAAHPDPAADVAYLARRLRTKPVSGFAHGADGHRQHITVTEARLAHMIMNDSGGYIVSAEVPAASTALRHGDKAPLLRLGVENDFPVIHGDPSDPKIFSLGDNIARNCTDATFQWDKQASPADRKTQFDQAVAALDPNRFAPFSISAWVVPPPRGLLPDPCIGWPAPTHSPEPPVPAGTVVPDVPALILTGDIDLSVPSSESARVAEMFPHSTIVSLKESGHHTIFNARSACSQAVIAQFIDTLAAGDTSCAGKFDYTFPAVGSFPARVNGNRRAAGRATASSLTDALLRSFLSNDGQKADGAGLRGGKYHGVFGNIGEKIRLDGVKFVRDLTVSGNATYVGFRKLRSTLHVKGSVKGTVHVSGFWNDTSAKRLSITGRLGGRKLSFRVPAL
jgi:pimeloyl-ACP methyl ester carboxylesterase